MGVRERLAGLKDRLAAWTPRFKNAGSLNQDQIAPMTNLLFTERSHQQTFAVAFCYGCFTVFCFPLMSAWMLAFDHDVTYWFGPYVFWWTLPIPLGFIFVFLYHMKVGRLRRGFVLGSVIIPCVVFFLLGTSLRFKAEHLKDHLLSVDCQQYPIMKELDEASKEAVQLYNKCNPSGYDILFPACADFEKWKDDTNNAQTWSYLQHLETNCLCMGFCKTPENSQPIWTHAKEWSHDPCSMCVVSAMDAHIFRVGTQMTCFGVITLFVFLVWHFLAEPTLLHRGFQHEEGVEPEYLPPVRQPSVPFQSQPFVMSSPPPPPVLPVAPVVPVTPAIPVTHNAPAVPISFRPSSSYVDAIPRSTSIPKE